MFNSSYKPGDRLVYGNNGVCVIEDICPKRFASDKAERLYYILKPINNQTATLFVPLENMMLRTKMRNVVTKREIDSLLTRAKNSSLGWIDNRSERLSSFNEILKSASQEQLVQMINCLYVKKQELSENSKKLSATDVNILSAAEKLVREEFAYALAIPQEQVGGYIHDFMAAT